MPISVVDYENLIEDPFTLGLFRDFVRMNPIIKVFPVVQKAALKVTGQVIDELPTPAYRDLNEQFSDSKGTTKPVEERPAVLGGSFNSDELFDELDAAMYRDPVDQQFDMWNIAIDRQLTNDVFNGDIDSNPKAFNGLYKRFGLTGGFPSASLVSASPGAGASLDVLTSSTTATTFLNFVDDAMYEADLWGSGIEGTPKGALFMNKAVFKGFQRAAKLAGLSLYTVDLLGYTWHSYMGIPLVDVGVQRDRSTEIILNTYDPGDAGNDCSRIYCCRFSQANGDVDSPGAGGLSLLQASPYRKLGPQDNLESLRYVLQWVVGLVHIGDSHCAACLEDFAMK
jgi:hypothetical protein